MAELWREVFLFIKNYQNWKKKYSYLKNQFGKSYIGLPDQSGGGDRGGGL
jgi:hypothetical protein